MKFHATALLTLLGLFPSVLAPAGAIEAMPSEIRDDIFDFAASLVTLPCPRMHVVAKNDPAVPTNGFNPHTFLVNAPVASKGSTSAGVFLYCSASSFGGVWMARLQPSAYTCIPAGSVFNCTHN